MRIEKLFRKAEKFFSLDKPVRLENEKKKEKLTKAFEAKIDSLKATIHESKSTEDKEALKKQLTVLMEFLNKLNEQ